MEASHLRAFPPPFEPSTLRRYLLFRLPPVSLFAVLGAIFIYVCFSYTIPPSLYGLMGSLTVGLLAWATFFCQRQEEQSDKRREWESDLLRKAWLQNRMRKRRRKRQDERSKLKALIRTRHRAQLELAVEGEEQLRQQHRDVRLPPVVSSKDNVSGVAGGGSGGLTPTSRTHRRRVSASEAVAKERDKEAQTDWVGRWARQASAGSTSIGMVGTRHSAPMSPLMTDSRPGRALQSPHQPSRLVPFPSLDGEGMLRPHSTSSVAAALGATVAAQERAALLNASKVASQPAASAPLQFATGLAGHGAFSPPNSNVELNSGRTRQRQRRQRHARWNHVPDH